jgi:DNA-directed RNA polymerase specialized sigma24 family protein
MADRIDTPGQPDGHDGDRPELLNDQKLVDVLREDDFQGPTWDRVADEWFRYGYATISGRVRTKQIFQDCRERGIPYPSSSVSDSSWSAEDVHDLAIDTVVGALIRFREDLSAGRWSKDGGALLTTFFIGLCILQFPNVYRAWRKRRSVPEESLDALLELATGQDQVADSRLDSDPARRAELHAEWDGLLEGESEIVKQMVLLRLEGYPYKLIAERLGVSRTRVSNDLARFKERARRRLRGSGESEEEGR